MSGQVRNLPPIREFTESLARSLGGQAAVLDEGEFPATAIAFDGGHHLVLIRCYGWSMTVSLPTKHSWSIQTNDEWASCEAKVKAAVAKARAKPKPGCSMADAIIGIRPLFARLSEGKKWAVDFPGVSMPTESWIKNSGTDSIGLFQQNASVMIVVWVGGDMRSSIVTSASEVTPLLPWIEQQIGEQRVRAIAIAKEAAAEAARKAALPLPKLDEVIAALKAGERFQTGGGRCHTIYAMKDGKFVGEGFDEGHYWDFSFDEQGLAAAIERDPDAFRKSH